MSNDESKSSEWEEALEDVHTRFILNLPPSELETADRIFFQLEQGNCKYGQPSGSSCDTCFPAIDGRGNLAVCCPAVLLVFILTFRFASSLSVCLGLIILWCDLIRILYLIRSYTR